MKNSLKSTLTACNISVVSCIFFLNFANTVLADETHVHAEADHNEEHDDVVPLATIIHPLDIGRHSSSVLSNSDADGIINLGNQILAQCNSVFRRQGSVSAPSGLPSIISSESDFIDACTSSASLAENGGITPLGVPRKVRVVNSIYWCGSIGTTIIGCAYTPGTCMVVKRHTAAQEGILWAHEFGHSKGLPHRSSSSDAVMFPSIASTRTVFNGSECNRVRALGFRLAHDEHVDIQPELFEVSIEQFVSQHYPHGMPYDAARAYTASDVDRIEPWLADQSTSEWWPNVSTVIGIVASLDSSQRLRDFIFSAEAGELPQTEWDGRFAAVMSLGYVVANNGDTDALDFLTERADPSSWSDVEWRAPFHSSQAEARRDLATAASLGLALAGRSGRNVIEGLIAQKSGEGLLTERPYSELPTLLLEAQRIEAFGLSQYYERFHRH